MAVTGIGEELRRERLRQGLTLDAICKRTKISVRSLEAIESEGFDRLPGVVFTRNFVRLYSLELKLNPDSLISRLPRVDIDAAPLPDPPRHAGRRRWDPRVTAAVAAFLWLVAAGVTGTGAWYYFNHYGRHLIQTVAAAPAPKAQVQRQAPAPVQFPQDQSGSAQAATVDPAPAQTADSQSQTPATQAAFDNNRPVQVILTAREAVWVQVSADGRAAFVGTLHPNDKRTIAADAQVKILTGNAGGLDISLNGKPLDPIGPRGQTRTVRLTAEGPQFGPQNPPPSSPL